MNNFYSLIYLTEELNTKLKGSVFEASLSPHKDVWEAFFSKKEKSKRVIFSAHPSETALFHDRYRASKKSNVTHFFETLNGLQISEIILAKNDRFITFRFENGTRLLFQLFGNRPNVFLIENGIINESFKSPDEYTGQPAPEPRGASSKKELAENMSPKKAILATDMKFPRHLIQPVIDHYNLDEKSPDECRKITLKLVSAMFNNPEFRVLQSGNICLVPYHLLPLENLRTFSTMTEAIRYAYYKTSNERRLSSKKQTLEPAINRQIKKLRTTINQLKNADKGVERAEMYEQYGHLLMANAHKKMDPATNKMELENLFNDNESIEIPVKPGLSVAENAQRYYDKSSDSLRNVEESKRRLKEAREALKKVEDIKSSFDNIDRIYEFDDWYKEHESLLKETGILSGTQKKKAAPYRKAEIEGYEVWIGKSAKSNDTLTADAHKEDIWLHARGVSGSHVVIRMNNQKEMPPKSVLMKAASIAAWNSKARGSGLAPVIITKRKYVTKSKGLPPGAVRVQREDVEMVKPQKYKS